MFIDFADSANSIEYQCDICIVGSGVIGLAIASHLLAHSKRRILLVEEGGLADTENDSAVPAEFNDGDVASGVAGGRARGFGGSSRRWGGQALPFSALDLAPRPGIDPAGGWPISWEELNRFYPLADKFLGLSPISFQSDLWKNSEITNGFGKNSPLELNISKYSPHPYLASLYQQKITTSSQVNCLLNAKVASVNLDSNGLRSTGVRIRNRHGKESEIKSESVVLCGGGIENPRILLASWHNGKQGIGNQQDLVGRYYQDHLGFFAARLEPIDWPAFHHLFASFTAGNQKYVPKIQLSQGIQVRDKLLNVTGNLDVQSEADTPLHSVRRLYHALRGSRPDSRSWQALSKDLKQVIRSAPEALGLLSTHFFEHRIAIPRKARYFLMANAESEPLYNSRIRLGEAIDIYGMARPIVEWRVSDRSFTALHCYGQALKSTLELKGIAQVNLSPYLTDPTANWIERAYSLYHHMGATRMSNSAKDGVVDTWGRIHGIGNLYIAGTSVLPTGSSSNPSYTALALAFRTAQHILAKL
ncbi:MAG: GMC oxidoreductase [Cyanobacteriota bacterium]